MVHRSDPSPSPIPLVLSGFKLNLTPHTWPLRLGLVLDEQREARAQLWGRVQSRADYPLTKGEIQLKHISVQVVEYHSWQLTETMFSSVLKAASKTVGRPRFGRSHRSALSFKFASTLRHSIFNLWYILLWSLLSMLLSCTVKRLAGLMYEQWSITYIVPQDNQWVCGSPQWGQTKTDKWARLRHIRTKGHFSGQLTNRTERDGMKLNKSWYSTELLNP